MKKPSSLACHAVTSLALLALSSCSDAQNTDTGSGGASGSSTTSGGNSTAASGAATAGSNEGPSGNGGSSAGGVSNPEGDAGSQTTPSGGQSGGSASGMAGGHAGGQGGKGGSSGSGGAAGASGSGGGASTGGASGKTDAKASAGCSKPASQTLNQWVDSMVMAGNQTRPYSVRLPTGYDPARPYPVIVLLHGCGSGTNNVPMEKATGTDAILVRGTGSASGTCWDTAANGPDVAFFDAMVTDVKARFCADEHRFFVVGYSSGSWLVNQLTCIRADVLRGGASVTGGESASGKCGGPVARIFIHDSDDTTNVISGSEKARDRQLTQNSCDKSAMPMPVDPSPCKLYQGCAAGYPVEWCQTSGQQHNRQDSLAPTTFWNFFKVL